MRSAAAICRAGPCAAAAMVFEQTDLVTERKDSLKPDPIQTSRRRSGTGLMLLCAGMLASMLSEGGALLMIGLVVELAGLAMFIGGMWQQKKSRDAQQQAALAEAQTPAGAAPAQEDKPAQAGAESAGERGTEASPEQ